MTIKNATKGNFNNIFAAPFGVTKQGDLLRFVVAVPQAEECKLKLYKKGCPEPVSTIHMDSSQKMGDVFFTEIDNRKLNADSYLYEANGREFVDFYAQKIVGREKFGAYLTKESPHIRGTWKTEEFDWGEDAPPSLSWADMILYKLHVRGFTKNSASEVKYKGTYLGVAEKAQYLKELGVNAVLLMPCVEFNEILTQEIQHGLGASYSLSKDSEGFEGYRMDEASEDKPKYRVNYWGYSLENQYFAPKSSYAAKPVKADVEFKQMVKCLHEHGIEVLMEMNFTGDITQMQIIDCLRYWIMEYHVDGFRINTEIVSEQCITSDPLLADTKLISAGWDMSRVRNITSASKVRLASYNDGFLANCRTFLKGDENKVGSFIERFTAGIRMTGIINYFAENNGFTLADVYMYEAKHNEANGEDNRDGTNCNFSWNCGVEGKAKKKAVNELRFKMRKNAIAALMLSQGTPMLLAGDEFGNSQDGNNNAYCQDNNIGWVDWRAKKGQEEFFQFVKQIIWLRKSHTMLHYPTELRRMDYLSCGCPDISLHGRKAWYPDYAYQSRMLGVMLCGRYASLIDGKEDDDFYIAFNMHWEPHVFDLPVLSSETRWKVLVSTAKEEGYEEQEGAGKQYLVPPRSIVVFGNSNKNKKKKEGRKAPLRRETTMLK